MSDVKRYECVMYEGGGCQLPPSVHVRISGSGRRVVIGAYTASGPEDVYLDASDALALAADLTRLANEAKSRGGE